MWFVVGIYQASSALWLNIYQASSAVAEPSIRGWLQGTVGLSELRESVRAAIEDQEPSPVVRRLRAQPKPAPCAATPSHALPTLSAFSTRHFQDACSNLLCKLSLL